MASIVFGEGLKWLVNATAKPERECRGLLGKWRRDHGDEALIAALGALGLASANRRNRLDDQRRSEERARRAAAEDHVAPRISRLE